MTFAKLSVCYELGFQTSPVPPAASTPACRLQTCSAAFRSHPRKNSKRRNHRRPRRRRHRRPGSDPRVQRHRRRSHRVKVITTRNRRALAPSTTSNQSALAPSIKVMQSGLTPSLSAIRAPNRRSEVANEVIRRRSLSHVGCANDGIVTRNSPEYRCLQKRLGSIMYVYTCHVLTHVYIRLY